MKASERRQEIIDILVERGHVKIAELTDYFSVTRQTIFNDLRELCFTYPIYTVVGRVGGGVYISEDYKPGKRYVNDYEVKVLKQILKKADKEERTVLEEIIKKFSVKHRTI